MSQKIFVDGEHGTTGLQIRERLSARKGIDILSLKHDERHDTDRRQALLKAADIAILCLPDDAAREAVAMADGQTRIIDTSTAHRTAPLWVFGFAELNKDQRQRIATAQFVANPGCYSTGAIALLAPLVQAGLMPADYPVTINAVSGYSGGGKQLIAQMENSSAGDHVHQSHFLYALKLAHKHVPEIIAQSGLTRRPVFSPSVSRFAQGMAVQIPLHLDLMKNGTSADDIRKALQAHYEGSQFVTVAQKDALSADRLYPEDFAGRDDMELHVFGDHEGRTANLVAMLDNLGKGAAGAAVQSLDLMLSA